MEGKNFIAFGASVTCDMGDCNQEFSHGDTLDGVSSGQLESMVRLGQAVTVDEFDRLNEGLESDEVTTEDDPSIADEHMENVDWKQTSVDLLDISDGVKKTLTSAGLTTAGAIDDYDEKNNGLAPIKGIGPAAEEDIRLAIIDLQ